MISQTEVTRKKITRGQILTMLYMSQTAPMSVQTIELALLPTNPQISGEVTPSMNFLRDRGYIHVIEPDEAAMHPMRGVLVRITDKGQDVVEGTVTDKSVLLPEH